MRANLLIIFVVAAGCATTPSTMDTRTGPASSGERVLNNHEAVELSTAAIHREGYQSVEVRSVEEVRPNYWRIRFGLAPRGSGRLLDVEFDGAQQDVVKAVMVGEELPTEAVK